MKKQPQDDWGAAIGRDPEILKSASLPKKNSRQDSLSGLVYYFSNSLPIDAFSKIGAPVNGRALIKNFKKLIDLGFSYSDIRGIINIFASNLKAKPLKPEVLAWKLFLANLDSLAHSFRTNNPNEEYGNWGVDPRLLEDD